MDKAPLPRFAWLMALYFRLIMVIDILVIPSTIAQQTHSSGSFWIGLVVGFILFWGDVFGHFRLFFAIMGLAWAWFGGIIAHEFRERTLGLVVPHGWSPGWLGAHLLNNFASLGALGVGMILIDKINNRHRSYKSMPIQNCSALGLN